MLEAMTRVLHCVYAPGVFLSSAGGTRRETGFRGVVGTRFNHVLSILGNTSFSLLNEIFSVVTRRALNLRNNLPRSILLCNICEDKCLKAPETFSK